MRRRETIEALLGVHERLTLEPASRTLRLQVLAPISAHAMAISALGPDAETMRACGVDPDPHCTVAVLPVAQPLHPETDEISLARALVGALETLRDKGALRAIAPEIERRLGALAACAREDRLVATARQGIAQ